MEKKNLAEILCNCPRGMKLDSTAFSELEFDHVDDKGRIKCLAGKIKDEVSLSKYGCVNNSPYANCVIFPEGKDTWEGFCPPCIPHTEDTVAKLVSLLKEKRDNIDWVISQLCES